MPVTIEEATEVDLDLGAAFVRLIPQLSSSSPPPDVDQLAEIIATPGTTVFMARGEDGTLVGSLTLVTFRIPTGLRAIIEDVVVDEAAARQGAGTALTKAALAKAESLGIKTVDLTSRPSREAANKLYQQLGFELRETNVYRYSFGA